jgi:DUF4097 and DUF4098 domain-containing protein YvlB
MEDAMKKHWLAAAFVLATLAPFTTARGQVEDTFRWSGTLATGSTIEIRGINGDIEASPGTDSTVEVRATKRGKKSDPREVTIEVVQDVEGVLVCAIYPSRDRDEPNRCRRDGEGSQTRDNDVTVDFQVSVPSGARLVAGTVNGGVRATGLSGDVEASTVNGEVAVVTAGTVTARTVNGSIEATTGRPSWTGELQFETVNGSITLRLPDQTRAEVSGKTVNGGIESDFPLTLESNRRWGPQHFEATLGGGGGGTIDLQTVNGSIRLQRS